MSGHWLDPDAARKYEALLIRMRRDLYPYHNIIGTADEELARAAELRARRGDTGKGDAGGAVGAREGIEGVGIEGVGIEGAAPVCIGPHANVQAATAGRVPGDGVTGFRAERRNTEGNENV
jgi:hypothetical protein